MQELAGEAGDLEAGKGGQNTAGEKRKGAGQHSDSEKRRPAKRHTHEPGAKPHQH